MSKTKKRPKTMGEELNELLDQNDNRKQILSAVVEKAIGGDMKAIGFIREILEEEKEVGEAGFRIELGPGVEELAK